MRLLTVYHHKSTKYDKLSNSTISFERFVRLLLISLRKTNLPITIAMIDGDEETKEDFKSLYGNITFRDYSLPKNGKYWEFLRTVEFDLWISYAESDPDETFLAVDNDVILRGVPTFPENFDVAFLYSPNGRPHEVFNKGVFAFRGKGLTFLKRWKELAFSGEPLIGDRNDRWFVLQLAAAIVFQQSEDLQFYHMPQSLHDGDLLPDSVVWHGYKNSKYEKYLLFCNDVLRLL